MSYILLNNFKLAFDKLQSNFKFNYYSYKLINDCIFLHIHFKFNTSPLHIKITTKSLYNAYSLYLALYQSTSQYLLKSINNYNYLSYVYNHYKNILYCIIDFDNLKRNYLIDDCLSINDDSFDETSYFINPIIINDLIIHNNNRFGFIEWNDKFDEEFENDFN